MRRRLMILCLFFSSFAGERSLALSFADSHFVVNEFIRVAEPMLREARVGRDSGVEKPKIKVTIEWRENYPSVSSAINVTGGFLRLPYVTSDALTFVLCHELGHQRELTLAFVGRNQRFSGEEVMADYLAGHTCFWRILKGSVGLKGFTGNPPPLALSKRVSEKCARQFPGEATATCERAAQAGQVLIEFLYREIYHDDYRARALDAPSFDRTWRGEPDFLQCRLLNIERGIFLEPPINCRDDF